MIRRLAQLGVLIAAGMLCGMLQAQTSSGTATVTVVAPLPYASVTITPASVTTAQGTTVTLGLAATGVNGTADGNLELFATAPGTTVKTLVSTYPLTNGSASCSYALPTTAPLGAYSLEAALCGSTKYKNSKDCK